jgi:hypothetical protein
MAPELLTLDEHDLGLSWVVDEPMQRASHALRDDDGRVWLLDPVDVPSAVERAVALGEPAGVVQLLDRHPRACAALAERLGVAHHRLPRALPGSPFELFDVVSVPRWREKGLWWPARQALVVPEAIGTHPMFSGGRPAGVHLLLRLLPPRGLRRYEPAHLLAGHGPPLHGAEAAGAVRDAIARSARDLPGVLARLPSTGRR